MTISDEIKEEQEAALRTVKRIADVYEHIEPKEATDDDE